MITELQGDRLPQWIREVRADDLPSLHTFANGLERDLAAVTADLTLPWSSGVVEGHVNRIKMIKRQRDGRASFALLRKLRNPAAVDNDQDEEQSGSLRGPDGDHSLGADTLVKRSAVGTEGNSEPGGGRARRPHGRGRVRPGW